MFGFQASGAAPIVDGAPVAHPQTIATAIRIGNPASWSLAEQARDESGGLIDKVTDREILRELSRVWRGGGHIANAAAAIAVVIPDENEARARERNRFDVGQATMQMMIAAADLVTEMTLVKHHFAAGVKAQAGIEF